MIGKDNGELPTSVRLFENRNVKQMYNVELHLKRLQLDLEFDMYNSYLVIPKWKKGKDWSVDGFSLRYMITFGNESMTPDLVIISLSSEENSYGVLFGRWYDGKMETHTLKKGFFHEIRITEVNEYVNMDVSCSKDSYYHCLAKRWANHDFKKS